MLRTHGDVSYKQEQRFHLELGLLKMVHAQRLLPLEQLLSESSLPAGGRTGTAALALASARGPVGARALSRLLPELLPALLRMTGPSARLRSSSTARAEAAGKPEMSSASTIGSLPAAQHAAAVAVAAPEAPEASPLDGQPADLETVRNAVLAALEEAGAEHGRRQLGNRRMGHHGKRLDRQGCERRADDCHDLRPRTASTDAASGGSLRRAFAAALGCIRRSEKRRAAGGIAASHSGWRARQGGTTSGGAANDGKIRRGTAHRARQRSIGKKEL